MNGDIDRNCTAARPAPCLAVSSCSQIGATKFHGSKPAGESGVCKQHFASKLAPAGNQGWHRFLHVHLLAAALVVVGLPQAVAAEDLPALQTVAVDQARIVREIAFDGVLEAVNQATVAAQTNARVEQIFFDVGDYVKQGEVIIRFRSTEQQARLSSAEAGVADARARLAEAELNYTRTRELFERKLVAKAALDSAAANLQSARARVDATVASEREAREGVQYTEVRAPYSGYVVKRHIEVGEAASVGQPLMTGLSLEQLRAVVEIPQTWIAPLREHRKARVILPDGRSIEAEQIRIPPNADPSTHTFRVLVTLPQGEHGAFPGTLVKIAFAGGERQRLLVPASAVVQRSEVTGVYVVGTDGRVSFRYVRAGTATAEGEIPILAGLTVGDRIATDPVAAAVRYKDQESTRVGLAP